MALAGLLERDTVTVQRQSDTDPDSVGDAVATFNTTNRGARPTSWRCRVQQMSAFEQKQHGIRGNNKGWKFLGATRPQVDALDRFTFTDSEGTSHTIKILGSERNGDNQGILWQVDGEEDSTEA